MEKEKNRKIKFVCTLCLCIGVISWFIWFFQINNNPETIYKRFLSLTGNGSSFFYENNLTGRIAWNQQYFMDSLLYMHEATGDTYYLDLFVQQADNVLALRDDKIGSKDFAGRSRPGWQAGGYYTLGVPMTIKDDMNKDSLLIQGIHSAGNNYTTVSVKRINKNNFDLIIRNNFRRNKPLEVQFTNLTMENIEEKINQNLSPQDFIYVQKLGSNPPVPGVYNLSRTYKMVIHEVHTSVIGLPFLRFADLVKRNPKLNKFLPKAEDYTLAMEESTLDYENSWVDEDSKGYYIFEKGGKYWASGLPVPYNVLSTNGIFFLNLYRVTGKEEYRLRAEKLAYTIKDGLILQKDGIVMNYWPDSFICWDAETQPENTFYQRLELPETTEDISHFSLTLSFILEAYQEGIVFDQNDLQKISRTFHLKIFQPNDEGYLTEKLDGSGVIGISDSSCSSFVSLGKYDPTIFIACLKIYENRYLNYREIDLNYKMGVVMLGWAKITKMSQEVQ